MSRAAESKVRQGHPWVYADSVRELNRPGETGEVAVIYDRKDRLLAVGLYDEDSPIRIRILELKKAARIDRDWLLQRLREAVTRRESLLKPETELTSETNGLRLVHGESDFLPALVLDRYGTILVLKIYSLAWLPRLGELTKILTQSLMPSHLVSHVVLRLSRNLQTEALHRFEVEDGMLIHGEPLTQIPTFRENGLRFEADVIRGQKTGFFLDQRENRRRIGELSAGKDVLNAFSFSGGFSLYAARGGARAVTDMDISAHALAAARRNVELNDELVADCEYRQIQGDVFRRLDDMTETFELVVLDPPSLARKKRERDSALKAYERLAAAGIRRLKRGGILFSASCSARVSAEDFFAAVLRSAQASRRRFRELDRSLQPVDHPAGFAEAAYLKGIYLEFEPA